MSDLNQCQFIGRLGKDPEMRYTTAGKTVASFSIACGEKWKDKNTGEQQEKTEWVNCTAFGKLAEIIEKYLKKGSQVYVSGKFTTDKYTDKQGIEKYSTKVIINQMQMLGSKGDNQAAPAQDAHNQAKSNGYQPKPKPAVPGYDDFDDDIPF